MKENNNKENSLLVKENELKNILLLLEKYENIIQNQSLSEKDNIAEKETSFIEYLKLKYEDLVCLRKEQKNWYEVLKNLDDPEYIKDTSQDEIEEMKKEVLGFYYKAKMKREELQKYVERTEKQQIIL